MKTLVVCATIFCLELVSSYPFPEPLPGYYGTYEQVPQQIQIPNIARSPDLYHQQQLAYIQQQDEKRRQNYENLLRNQNLNQRLSSHLLQRPSYNIQPVLNTVNEPYATSIPLQRPIQEARYEAPITQQYYPVQQPTSQYQPVQSQQYEETRSEAAVTQAVHQINNLYSQPHYPGYNVQNLAYHPRIQQVLATTPLKKRYLVLHPNGTIEHIDKIEHIVEQHPNYILVNAANVAPKPNEPVATAQSLVHNQQSVPPVVPATLTAQAYPVPASPTPALVAPVAPVVPATPSAQVNPAISAPNVPGASATTVPQENAVPEASTPSPVAPVAPLAPVMPAILSAQVNPVPSPVAPIAPVAPVVPSTSVSTSAQANASPTPASAVAQADADPASPVTSPASAPLATVPPAVPSTPAPTSVAPVLPSIQNGTVPGPKPTVQPPTGPTTALPPVSAPTAQPPVILNGTVPGPTTIPPTTNVTPTTQPPIWVTATATAVYPPPTTPLPPATPPPTTTPVPPTVTPVPPTATPAPPVVGPVTPLPPTETPIPPVTATATAIATTAPSVTTTPGSVTEGPDSLTTVAPYIKPSDPTDLDLLQVNTGTEPVVWFRTKDLDFWKKLTSGKEVYDIVYFFNVPREPRVMKDTKTTIHADGTVVEEITQTIYDDEDDETPPRVIKTTTITKPDGTQTKT